MKITETIQTPHQSSRGNFRPELIVMHTADGTYEGTKSWFMNKTSQISSHFVVGKEGQICQCVPLNRMAWCNGTTTDAASSRYFGHATADLVRSKGGNANQYSSSIEFEGFHKDTGGALTPRQLDAAVWLVGHIQAEVKRLYSYTIPLDRKHIIGHFEVTPRTRPNCPGAKFPWAELLRRLQPAPEPVREVYAVMKQVGAFSERESAEKLAAEMRAKEPQAYWFVEKKKL